MESTNKKVTPVISRIAAQPLAQLRLKVPRTRIREVMGPGLKELRAEVARQGGSSPGPWFTHHFPTDPDSFDFAICLPIAGAMTAAGRIEVGEWPAMTVARMIHAGDYGGLAAGWGELDAWITAQGKQAAPDFWERYLVGPDEDPSPVGWRTELSRQVGA